jgi:hypothetical protein
MLIRWNGCLPTVHRILGNGEGPGACSGQGQPWKWDQGAMPTGIFAFITNFLYLE